MNSVPSTSFAHPQSFWLLPGLVFVFAVALWGWRRQRRALAELGREPALGRLLLVDPWSRRLGRMCLVLGLVLLLIGSAGPQWGSDEWFETTRGQDVVLVLDTSRSMQAEQPSRLERALRALRDLADRLQRRGGHRVALVTFAGRPHLAFPMTDDYDHLRHVLGEIEAGDFFPGARAQRPPVSGTRIGAALRLALRTGAAEATPIVLLVSDGDDPAGDEEWTQGVHEARSAGVAIHTVGVGNPSEPSRIPLGNEFLLHDGKVVKTRLEEKPLQEIARRTGGTYVPARTSNLPLGSLFDEMVRGRGSDSEAPSFAPVPVLRQRYAWFLAPALAILAASLLLSGRPRSPGFARLGRVAPAILAMLALSAGPLEENVVRQGNAAFADGKFDEAVSLYEKAEPTTRDPGLVAFNKAAALYRAGRFREAELHYRRCLEDESASSSRRAQGFFGVGIARMRQAGESDAVLLDRAIDAFGACLSVPNVSAELADDARHNLELARWLRMRARSAPQKDPENHQPLPDPKKEPHKKPERNGEKQSGDPSGGEPDKNGKGLKETQDRKKEANPGAISMLPDLVPLPLEDLDGYLDQVTERIRRERRSYLRRAVPVFPEVKDW